MKRGFLCSLHNYTGLEPCPLCKEQRPKRPHHSKRNLLVLLDSLAADMKKVSSYLKEHTGYLESHGNQLAVYRSQVVKWHREIEKDLDVDKEIKAETKTEKP